MIFHIFFKNPALSEGEMTGSFFRSITRGGW
jgi:hypothetical protein